MILSLLLSLPALAASPSDAASPLNALRKDGTRHDTHLRLHAELGTLTALSHTIQYGQDGTEFDYVDEGGQDVLFPFARVSTDFDLSARHSLVLLYQPLDLRTQVTLQRDVRWDGVDFAAGTPVDIRYGFDFTRGSYLYDLKPGNERELAIGGSLQIRNANIEITSADGTLRSVNRDVGPVPLIKGRWRQPIRGEGWLGAEVDAAWAPIRYINGADSDVEGALLDASFRAGTELRPGVDAFVNLRYLGGGAVGTANGSTPPGDGYTDNWLQFASLSLGFSVR
jgi:hypothetical protein